TDRANLAHGRLPSKWCVSTQPPYGTLMPQSGRRPQHHKRPIETPPAVAACPLRPDRFRNSAPQRIDAVCQNPTFRGSPVHSEVGHRPSNRDTPFWLGCAVQGESAMKRSRRGFLHLATGAAALSALPRITRAQTYPSRPVHIILGFPP